MISPWEGLNLQRLLDFDVGSSVQYHKGNMEIHGRLAHQAHCVQMTRRLTSMLSLHP